MAVHRRRKGEGGGLNPPPPHQTKVTITHATAHTRTPTHPHTHEGPPQTRVRPRALGKCVRCARTARMAKGTAVTTVFPCSGLRRFLLSPKTQAMNQETRCFTLKVPECRPDPPFRKPHQTKVTIVGNNETFTTGKFRLGHFWYQGGR